MDAVTEEKKLLAISDIQEHIADAKKEREFYRSRKENALKEIENREDRELSNDHYTFHFAQHFQLPHNSRQIGPIYFLQLLVFGVRIDSVSKQLNFIVDENKTIGVFYSAVFSCYLFCRIRWNLDEWS